jgi:TrmH RNA methyltransferase
MKSDTICGLSAVSALFRRRPGDVQRLFYNDAQRHKVGEWCALLAADRRPYRMLPDEELSKAAGTTHHGGVVAVARPRQVSILFADDLPAGIKPRGPRDVLLVLDGVGNPHNVGAIIRSAAFFGVRGLVLHEVPSQAMLSDAVYRTAEGGLEEMELYRTRDLPRILTALTTMWRTVATSLDRGALRLDALPRDRPVALVLGNEEHGVSPPVLLACRRQVRIAGAGEVQSLNVAQATAVLLHDLTRLTA